MKPFEATRLLPDQGRSLRSHCKQLCNLKDFTFSSWRVCCVLSLPQTVYITLRSFSALYCSSALDSDGARSTSPWPWSFISFSTVRCAAPFVLTVARFGPGYVSIADADENTTANNVAVYFTWRGNNLGALSGLFGHYEPSPYTLWW